MDKSEIEKTDIGKVLQLVVDYVNDKNKVHNEANKANFPVISVGNIVDSSMKNENISVLVDGGIKGVQKHTIPYADLNFRKSPGPGRPKKVEA